MGEPTTLERVRGEHPEALLNLFRPASKRFLRVLPRLPPALRKLSPEEGGSDR